MTYTVTAADGTSVSYTVTVTVALNTAKAITAYSFASPAAMGTIDESGKTISVTVPYGTNVTNLIASFSTTGESVKVGSAVQTSGTTGNDFTSPVIYTVTAADGTSVSYTVTVTIAPRPRFQNNNDGTITDNNTGRMWIQSISTTKRTWQNSVDYCNALVFAGYSDWSMPSIAELEALVQGWSGSTPKDWFISQGFSGFSTTNTPLYWSANDYPPLGNLAVYIIALTTGTSSYEYKTSSIWVWCVR